jgi:hypothetical protein
MYRAGGKRRWRQRHTHNTHTNQLNCNAEAEWRIYTHVYRFHVTCRRESRPFFSPFSSQFLFAAFLGSSSSCTAYCILYRRLPGMRSRNMEGKKKKKLANGEKCTYIGGRQASQPASAFPRLSTLLPAALASLSLLSPPVLSINNMRHLQK